MNNLLCESKVIHVKSSTVGLDVHSFRGDRGTVDQKSFISIYY